MTTPTDRIQYYQKSIEPYTNRGTDRLKRHWQFLISDTNDIIYFRVSAITSVITGAFAGAAAGFKITDGNKTAGVAGGLGGGVVASMAYMTITERTKQYTNWINVKMDYIIDSALCIKYSDDPILKNFICPIEQTVTLVPTRTPNGHLFDFNALMKGERDRDGNIKDPFRGPSFAPSSLMFDHETATLINKRFYHLIAADINAAGEDEVVKNALSRQLGGTRERIKICYRGCLDIINDRLDNEKISFDESQDQRRLFAERFGKTPEHQLDWGQDWKWIVDTRWLADHPDSKIYG